ncbi:MAG TPA: DUF3536 domain-containing protein [Thermoanaerobaculia bacterium]|nr:DUF3536 domain-containing protein [Thermoanaerobaculia bacterium]
MTRYVCVHGHFYQPPRENPWLEAIEVQDSAFPYHDWNERITDECYAANAASRILDAKDRIAEIVNNYARISFDFGPTLLSWLEHHAPDVYAAVLDADRESRERFSGHGSALAQAYNHVILPLAGARDRRTQVLWGIADFRSRFGREPEGMWLPEAAVDLPSLEALAEAGIRFTILAPHQARARRPIGTAAWTEVGPEGIDPTRAYRAPLPSGRSIDVFFYDAAIARDVAFGGLLHSGQQLAERLLNSRGAEGEASLLVHLATDGETYGHHHPHGDMALAYALRAVEEADGAALTNYAEFLERHPPDHEVQIRENTSWSCVHGIERWRNDCGCATGARPGWNQAWRAPLREALDGLRDAVAGPFEARAGKYLSDPWRARDASIDVVLDRSAENIEHFFAEQSARPLSSEERVAARKLLELQRHAMLMYTSCGWFFDDLAGVEALQVFQYAGRVATLAEELFEGSFQGPLREALSRASSNRPEAGDGRALYDRQLRIARVDLPRVGGHYAVRSLFEPYDAEARIYCYAVERQDYRFSEAGPLRLGLGRARFTSDITGESARLAFAALHLGSHNVHGGVCAAPEDADWETLAENVQHAFSRADVAEMLRLFQAGFGSDAVSVKTLFGDDRRRVLREVIESTREEAEEALRRVHEKHLPLMRFLADLGSPLPRVFRATAELIANAALREALGTPALDGAAIAAILEEAHREKIPLDAETLEYAVRQRLDAFARDFAEQPEDLARLETLRRAVELSRRFPFPVRLWRVQNVYWRVRESQPEGARDAAWREAFAALGELLSVRPRAD